MKKEKIICGLLIVVGVAMISMAIVLQTDTSLSIEEVDIKSMAASSNMYVKDKDNDNKELVFEAIEMGMWHLFLLIFQLSRLCMII